MNVLSQDFIDDFVDKFDDDAVLSCGVDPHDNCLYLVSFSLRVGKILPNGKLIPEAAFPHEGGTKILVSFKGVEGVYCIDSELAVQESVSIHNSAKLYLSDTYVCDLLNIETSVLDAKDEVI